MQIKVVKTNQGKTQKGKDKTGLYDGTKWYNILGAHNLEGKTVDLEEGEIKGWYKLGKVYEASSQNGGPSTERMNQFRALDMAQFYWTSLSDPSIVPAMPEETKQSIICSLIIASTRRDSILRYEEPEEEPEPFE